jgi:nucleoside-diphosphate-sugar epimerase
MTTVGSNTSTHPDSPPHSQGTILIAGAGYLGTEILRQLRARGYNVLGLRRDYPGKQSRSGIRKCDLTNPDDLESIRSSLGDIEAVIHCASSGHGDSTAYQRIFIEATSMLHKILAPKFLLLVSSTSVLPQVDGSMVDERSPTTSNRETAKILLQAEDLVLRHSGTVARCSGLYGPGRSVLLKRFLLGEAGIDSEGPDGELPDGRLVNQIHRDDAASGIVFLLNCRDTARGELFHLSDGHPMTQGEIYRGLVSRFGGGLPPRKKPDPNGKRGWTNKAVSSAKLQSLGWDPRYPNYLAALDEDPELISSIQAQIASP